MVELQRDVSAVHGLQGRLPVPKACHGSRQTAPSKPSLAVSPVGHPCQAAGLVSGGRRCVSAAGRPTQWAVTSATGGCARCECRM